MIIMSNNLWNRDSNSPAWAARGEDCSADARVGELARAYQTVLPDVLGFQEMSRHMEYVLFSRMRRVPLSDGETVKYELISGGYTPMMYRHDKFRLLESGHALFPRDFPPYEGCFNDADSKGFTYGVFEDRASGRRVAAATAHLWWRSADPASRQYQAGSAEARAAQIGMVCEKADALIAKFDCPAVLMGDLNDKLGSPCLNAAKRAGFAETHALCVGERDDRRGYHYCFPDGWRHGPDGVYEDAIDHVLIKNAGNTAVREFRRFMEPYFDRLSDHFPVYIDLSL